MMKQNNIWYLTESSFSVPSKFHTEGARKGEGPERSNENVARLVKLSMQQSVR